MEALINYTNYYILYYISKSSLSLSIFYIYSSLLLNVILFSKNVLHVSTICFLKFPSFVIAYLLCTK